ncbi:MAG: translation initiation factor IF-2 [SAR202 cluster bacterium]|nr:translation initiation factor IF-2 [SAR202 cluster bacterium]|tara:strand:+ start:23364 stop:25142 length:1779 start_codon:yes stop_codon:yes gene_type:complete
MEQEQSEVTTTRKVTLKALPIGEAISVGVLADKLQVDPVQVIKQLMRAGIFASMNQAVDFETASVVARAFGFAARKIEGASGQGLTGVAEDSSSKSLEVRPAVVTILGHVDHGKTTLLDAIRSTNVVDREAGGITQHIGAYQVTHNDSPITFIDTPGHEAFTAMRARGAQVTDIAVLVIAADDGVMPQTSEAINHIKAAEVPIIVAINKMDSLEADPEKIRRQLAEHDLLVEKWGGDVIDAEVSAKTGEGLSVLLENIELVAEMAELKADPARAGVGVVVEAELDRSRGVACTVLVQTGTLRVGDFIVVGSVRGRVKALVSDKGQRIESAGPSMPVEVLGLNDLPIAGDRLVVVQDEKTARMVVEERLKNDGANRVNRATLEDVGSLISQGQAKELSLILKTDVQGSVDAVRQSLEQLGSDDALVRIVHSGTGAITETDVLLAVASEAIIIGFNVKPDQGAQRLADHDKVQIRQYDIIYRLTEDIEKALKGLLEPEVQDFVEGTAEVRAIFALGRTRKSAGCYITDGKFTRGDKARVIRGGQEIFDGAISGLKRFKDDVREVLSGYECGLSLDGFNDFFEGDIIEAHRERVV